MGRTTCARSIVVSVNGIDPIDLRPNAFNLQSDLKSCKMVYPSPKFILIRALDEVKCRQFLSLNAKNTGIRVRIRQRAIIDKPANLALEVPVATDSRKNFSPRLVVFRSLSLLCSEESRADSISTHPPSLSHTDETGDR